MSEHKITSEMLISYGMLLFFIIFAIGVVGINLWGRKEEEEEIKPQYIVPKKTHNHEGADKLKGNKVWLCPICKKPIVKGKGPKKGNGCFGAR